jgi:rhodanese-related sulfurtransferase
MYSDISISRVKPLLNDINIIDIREERIFKKGSIPNSINIPIYKLLSDPAFYLKKDNKYFIYCHKGCSSKYACKILASEGYKVFNILGGYKAWVKEK